MPEQKTPKNSPNIPNRTHSPAGVRPHANIDESTLRLPAGKLGYFEKELAQHGLKGSL